jgi:hypothetical protein
MNLDAQIDAASQTLLKASAELTTLMMAALPEDRRQTATALLNEGYFLGCEALQDLDGVPAVYLVELSPENKRIEIAGVRMVLRHEPVQ